MLRGKCQKTKKSPPGTTFHLENELQRPPDPGKERNCADNKHSHMIDFVMPVVIVGATGDGEPFEHCQYALVGSVDKAEFAKKVDSVVGRRRESTAASHPGSVLVRGSFCWGGETKNPALKAGLFYLRSLILCNASLSALGQCCLIISGFHRTPSLDRIL